MAWQYLEIRKKEYGNFIDIWPLNRVDLQWLNQRFRNAKIQRTREGVARVEFKETKQQFEAFQLLLEYVGAQGWQPFASHGTVLGDITIALKRDL